MSEFMIKVIHNNSDLLKSGSWLILRILTEKEPTVNLIRLSINQKTVEKTLSFWVN